MPSDEGRLAVFSYRVPPVKKQQQEDATPIPSDAQKPSSPLKPLQPEHTHQIPSSSSSAPTDDAQIKLQHDIQQVLTAHHESLKVQNKQRDEDLKRARDANAALVNQNRGLKTRCERLEANEKRLEANNKRLLDCVRATQRAVNAQDIAKLLRSRSEESDDRAASGPSSSYSFDDNAARKRVRMSDDSSQSSDSEALAGR